MSSPVVPEVPAQTFSAPTVETMVKPMKYTSTRIDQYETLKIFRRTMTPEQYRREVADLNRRQKIANANTARADARAEARFQALLQAQEEARKAKQAKAKADREAKRIAKQQGKPVKVAVSARFKCKKEDSNGNPYTVKLERTTNIDTFENKIDSAVKAWVDSEINHLVMDSKFLTVSLIKSNVVSTEVITPAKADKKKQRMKSATALDLDGHTVQSWDTGNGTCVYDFLIWRYGKKMGCKKVCGSYEALDEIFGSDARENGVSIEMLQPLCDAIRVRMYAMDDENNLIHSYTPLNINKDLHPLIFRVKNAHFYAILDMNMSISRIGKRITDMAIDSKEVKELKESKKNLNVVVLPVDDTKAGIEQMIDIIQQHKTEVFPFKNIQFDTNGLRSFILGDTKYMLEDDESVSNAKRIAEVNEQPYTGESTFSILVKLLNELKYDKKSICSPHTYDSITAENVKWRTHYGATVPDITEEQLQVMIDNGEAICADIAKCYTACIENPYDDFITLHFRDSWAEPNDAMYNADGTLKTGLYFISTGDMTLFHGSNIYSNKIIDLAKAEGISYSIDACLLTTEKQPRNYFHALLTAIDTMCKGDKDLKKSLTNIITGFLGKQSSTRYTVKLNTDVESIWNDFTEREYHENDTFMYHVGDHYLYGYKHLTHNAETNVPMYIQVLDWSNMRLYDMIKQSGGECLYRKTDCAVIRGGSLTYGKNNGDYRVSPLPTHIKAYVPAEHRSVMNNITYDRDFITHPSITNSNQVDEVYDILMKTRGLLNVSRAGTGKTYNCLKIEERFKAEHDGAKVYKIAFTNKACLNFKGTTIHKFLKIDQQGRFNLTWLNSLREQKVLVIIDEISMIGEFLWRRLVELKKALPKAYIMLLGDYRQAPPVEENPIDYFNHSAVKYLANYTKVEFTVRQRYDEALWDFAEDVYERQHTDMSKVNVIQHITPGLLENTTNICFYNSTRKDINEMVNKYVAKKHSDVYSIEFESDNKKALQQSALLYVGCPIIAHKNYTTRGGGEVVIHCVNNETFTITEIDDERLVASSKRTDDDGEEIDHTFTIDTDEFHEYFCLNYCSTTHKQQGATINNNVIIFDYDYMSRELKYTAITRVKKLTQISMYMNDV